MKLAEGLLRRKELQEKLDRIGAIRDKDLFEVKVKRQAVTENVDDIVASVPKCSLAEVNEEYDFYAKRLRLVDAAIQRTNWETDLDVQSLVMDDYKAKDKGE